MDTDYPCAPAHAEPTWPAGSVATMKESEPAPALDALQLAAYDVAARAAAIVDAVKALSVRADVHPLELHENAVADCERHLQLLEENVVAYRDAVEMRRRGEPFAEWYGPGPYHSEHDAQIGVRSIARMSGYLTVSVAGCLVMPTVQAVRTALDEANEIRRRLGYLLRYAEGVERSTESGE